MRWPSRMNRRPAVTKSARGAFSALAVSATILYAGVSLIAAPFAGASEPAQQNRSEWVKMWDYFPSRNSCENRGKDGLAALEWKTYYCTIDPNYIGYNLYYLTT
jgi:hypothetical protein